MGFMDEYNKLKKKRTEEAKEKTSTKSSSGTSGNSFMDEYNKIKVNREASRIGYVGPIRIPAGPVIIQDHLDSTFVGPKISAADKYKTNEEATWFQKGAFEDGYQFGDVTKTIIGSKTDAQGNVGTGLIGMGEKALDALLMLGAAMNESQMMEAANNEIMFNSLTGKGTDPLRTLENYQAYQQQVEDGISEMVAKDLYDEEKIAKKILVEPTEKITGIDVEENSVFGEKSDALAQSAGELIGTYAISATGVPWWLVTGLTAFGGEAENALNEGATFDEANLSATITAGAEVLTEKISGGISFGGKTLDAGLTKALAQNISNKYVRAAFKVGIDYTLEGSEEWLTEDISTFGKWLTYQSEEDLKELLSSEEAMDAKIEAYIGGGFLGGVSNVGKAVKSNINGVDPVTELTNNEQKVFDKVYADRLAEAEGSGKLTQKTKSKIYDSVLNDMEKGYISTDTIEEVLGGETFKTYKSTIDSEDSLLKEYEELGKKQNATLAEQSRYAELSQQIKDINENSQRTQLKSQLSDEVLGLVKGEMKGKGSRLLESYNEQSRRGQAYEADLTQYDTSQQKVIQNAIDSGILNNTNRTHEFVDLVAKISADKGVPFDFTNNAKLKDSGFAIDGKTVNGFVTKDGVTVNVDSAKYVNSVVGHEITHVLEGSELYTELQNALFDYAKSKNDYQGRYDSLAKLYENVEGADIDSELTADLVGDYLFTDSDFINKLSVEHRNVFQKIFDEIKYMLKVATAGSREARELEKVKKAFEDAYRASGKAQTDTKYSISDKNIKDVNTGYAYDEYYYTMSYEQDGATVGTLEYGVYEGNPNVKMIEVDPKYRRKGIATKLLQELQKKYDGKEIDFGMSTPDGTKLLDSITYNVTDETVVADRQKLKNLQAELNDLEAKIGAFDELFDSGAITEAQRAEFEALGEQWDEVYRSINELAPTLRGKKSTKTFVKTDTKYSLSDTEGKQLTKEQQDFFKDSKMRDENGNLKVMYHGSQDAGFHIFDSQMSDDDTSFFFVDRNDVAASYSGTSETYEAKTIRTAEDMNNFIAEIGYDEDYSVVEKDGKFELIYDGDRVASSDTAQGIYEEFCWYEGIGDGDANYKVYLNLTNPLVVDAEGRNWNNISREFSQEIADRYKSLTAEEKAALTDLAGWGEYSVFKDEMLEARANAEQGVTGVFDETYTKNLARAYEKLGGANANLYDAFSIASDNFSEESINQFAVKQMNTRDYAQKAKEQGYDGVIFNNIVDNGGYSNGSEGASTVAIAFDSNQIKSVANAKPTSDPDIRYSLTEYEQAKEDVVNLDGGSVTKYSLSTWTPETQTKVRDNLIKAGYESSQVDKWIKDTNSVASVIASDKDRLDFEAADNQVMLKDNQEYIKTLDASTLCAKRLVYQGTFDAIQHRMPNTMLSSDDLIDLLNMMKEHGVQTPCGVCYVESRRRHLGKFAQEWLNGYNGEYKPNLDEVTTSDGLEALRKSHPATYKDFISAMNKKGSSNPKVVQLRTEYRNEIMSLTPAQISKIEAIGGLRVQSFSDFETPHMLDMMQAVMDMSAKGLHSQAYTKVPNFAWVFGDTGIKINLSLIAEGDGFDSDGNLAFSSVEGMNIDDAMKLRDAYSQNVGTIIVGANDKHILACMADDRIDFIIPFHRSGWGTKELDMMGMSSYVDYTYGQKEHDLATGKGLANLYPPDYWDYNLSGKENAERYLNLCAKTGREPKFSNFLVNNGDGSYSLQPDGSTDGYWKTLIDFKMYDNDGNGAAQQKVQPNFNMEEAYRVLNEYEGGANELPVANDVVEEFVAKYQPYEELAPAMSLSEQGETPKRYGDYAVSGKDISLETAPVQESVAPVIEKPAPVQETTTDLFPDDLAPMTEEEALDFLDRFTSLDDVDAPPEVEAPYPDESAPVTVDDPFENRSMRDVGNRKVKAYMYENPDVKPFFQSEAEIMLSELLDSTKGERWYNDDLYYQTGGEKGWGGTKRHTSREIAYLLDQWDYTYDEIEQGLSAIIEDNGKENNACSKRIEFLLDERLRKGYKDFYSNGHIPPNQDYINLLNEKQVTEYSKEAFDRFMESADDYAPPEDVVEDVAPVAENVEAPVEEAYEAIRPKPTKEPRMARATPEEQASADVLVEEPETEKKKSGVWSMLKNNVLDKGMVFEDLSLATGNRELQARWNSIRYAEGKAQRFMEKGNSSVNSLKSIREAVEQTGKTKEFYEYLYHKHNADRMTLEDRYEDVENKPVFSYAVTSEISQEAANKLENDNPEFKQYAQEVYDYMNYLREMLVDGGVISQETAKLWSEMYPHYVPIRRDGDAGLNINVPLDTGRTGVNAPVKRATGGNRDILPLFDTMGQRTIQTYKAIAKNRFGVELKNTLGTTIENELFDIDEAIDSIDSHEDLLQEGKNGQKPTFTVFENGEKVTFEITDEMYDAMKPKSKAMSYTNKVLNKANNIRRGLLTEYNPAFMLTNPIKDTQDVLINSQHPLKTYANFPKAISELIGKKGRWYQEYMENGGEQNTYFDDETNTFEKEKSGFVKAIGFPLEKISEANNFIERVPRLAEYIASRQAGRSVDVSMLDAARVTTNFAAGGDLTRMLNRNGFTFLNASVQGAVQQVRNVREAKANGLKGALTLAAKATVAGLAPLLLNHLLWDDDEEYEELSDYVKQNYYIVGKFGDGKFVRIPKGRALAVIQNAFEQMENAVTGNDEVDLSTFGELLVSNLAPNNPLENNIFAPISQAINNKTWYGDDLVPTRLQDLPAEEQFDETTDSISKWLGEKTGTSPYKWNYLLDQYSGAIGDVFLPMITPEAERGNNSLLGNMIAPISDKFTTDSVMKNQTISDFYSLADELTTNAKSSKATEDDDLKYKYINSVNSELSELYAKKREIQNSDLSDEGKYEAVREIQQQIVDLAEEGLNTYDDISFEDEYREGGEYARIGDRVYKKNDEGEWQKLSDEQLTKYEVTKAAGDASYATDGENHYRWYVPEEDSDSEPGWKKITDDQLEKQEEVTDGLGISPEEYWGNKAEYDYAYKYPGNYAVAKAVGGYDSFKTYSSELYDIKADKDEDGKSISGSRKEKVAEYINNLDADYGEKIILFKNEYNADDTYNYEIIDYLNSRDDISYAEMETILKELGFTVDSDGTIRW